MSIYLDVVLSRRFLHSRFHLLVCDSPWCPSFFLLCSSWAQVMLFVLCDPSSFNSKREDHILRSKVRQPRATLCYHCSKISDFVIFPAPGVVDTSPGNAPGAADVRVVQKPAIPEGEEPEDVITEAVGADEDISLGECVESRGKAETFPVRNAQDVSTSKPAAPPNAGMGTWH